jgi:hypothetical protein
MASQNSYVTPTQSPTTHATEGEESKAERKKRLARERAARLRERKRAAKAAPRRRAKRPDDDVSAPSGPTAAETPTKSTLDDQRKAQAEMRERLERIALAISGTIEGLAAGAKLIWLRQGDPALGHNRADTMGTLWAPVLEPYLRDHPESTFAVIMAAGGTSACVAEWAHEIREARKATATA